MHEFVFDDYIRNVEDIKNAEIIFYSVSKRELVNEDYTRIKNNLKLLNSAEKYARGKMMITFDGFDNDKREIYEIPEIRKYVKNIWNEYNHIFYFLTPLANNRSIIFACLNDFKSIHNVGVKETQLHIIYDKDIKQKTIDAMYKYSLKINDLENLKKILDTFI